MFGESDDDNDLFDSKPGMFGSGKGFFDAPDNSGGYFVLIYLYHCYMQWELLDK